MKQKKVKSITMLQFTSKVLKALGTVGFLTWFVTIVEKAISSKRFEALGDQVIEAKDAQELYTYMKNLADEDRDAMLRECCVILMDVKGLVFSLIETLNL